MGPPHPCWEDGHTSSPWPAAPRISCCLHPLLCSQSFGIDGENLRQIDRNTLVWSDPTLLLKILFLQGLCFTLSEHLISSWRQTTGFEWTVASLEGRALMAGLHWTRDRAHSLPVQPWWGNGKDEKQRAWLPRPVCLPGAGSSD